MSKDMFFHLNGVIVIKTLEEKILKEGQIFPGNVLRVSGFLNQQIDTEFLPEIGKEISRLFKDSGVTKILTVEASGIAIAVAAAYEMKVPVVFAKKGNPSNLSKDCYSADAVSYTKHMTNKLSVSKEYIDTKDRVLVLDDFLATGEAINALENIVKQAGATLVGVTSVIEKGFQQGGDNMRERGVRVESLAIIDSMTENSIVFRKQN